MKNIKEICIEEPSVRLDDSDFMSWFDLSADKDMEIQSTSNQTKKNYWWSSLRLSEGFIRKKLENFEIIEIGRYKRSGQIFSRFRKR